MSRRRTCKDGCYWLVGFGLMFAFVRDRNNIESLAQGLAAILRHRRSQTGFQARKRERGLCMGFNNSAAFGHHARRRICSVARKRRFLRPLLSNFQE